MFLKIIKKILKYFSIFVLFLVSIYVSVGLIYGNFYQLDKDAYRSAQLFSFNMPYYLKKYKIKTMLNLRGSRPNQEWYQDEMAITQKYHVVHIDHQIRSGGYLDYNRTSQIVQILRDAKKPMIIHCQGGADRTSLVSALYTYAIMHKSKEEARKELRWFYGHLPSIRKKVIAMENSFDNYVDNANKEKENYEKKGSRGALNNL